MTEPAISAAFFDRGGGLSGSLRAGGAVLFHGERPEVTGEPHELARDGEGWRARMAGQAELAFEAISEAGSLGGAEARLCRVRGRVGEATVDSLGTITETSRPPAWAELDATRSITVVLDSEHALLAFARRPRGARGHGEEEITGWLLDEGRLKTIEDARLSTIYDGEGRQRSASLELWLPGEDFPRRAAGEAQAGVSLALEGVHVHAALFSWRMDGREGPGAYDLTVRGDDGEAA